MYTTFLLSLLSSFPVFCTVLITNDVFYNRSLEQVTPDIIPVDIIVLDASYCQIEYNVPPCADPTGECVSQQTKSITTPMDVEVGISLLGCVSLVVVRDFHYVLVVLVTTGCVWSWSHSHWLH